MSQVNPYAPPEHDPLGAPVASGSAEGVYREGDVLVVPSGATLPARCVQCNTPVEDHQEHRKLWWAPPWIFALVLISWLIMLIVYFVVRKGGDVTYSLCPEHLQKRTQGRYIVLGSVGAMILFLVAGVAADSPLAAIFGFLLGIIGLIVGVVRSQVLKPMKIDKTHLRLKVGDAFLQSF